MITTWEKVCVVLQALFAFPRAGSSRCSSKIRSSLLTMPPVSLKELHRFSKETTAKDRVKVVVLV